jgi:hypothetical protein
LTATMHDRERDGEVSAYVGIAFCFGRAALAIEHQLVWWFAKNECLRLTNQTNMTECNESG